MSNNGLNEISTFDALQLVINTAVEVRDAGHPLQVVQKDGLIVIAIEGYELIDGKFRAVAAARGAA